MNDVLVTRQRALVAAGLVLLALVGAGRVVPRGPEPAAEAAEPPVAVETLPPRRRVVVHVVGAVRRPGLYKLVDGSRVADAIRRAGGATGRADVALINLAAPVADGAQVAVPARAPPGSAAATGAVTAPAGPVSLSAATLEQLDALPGVGPATAQKILDYRAKNGAFRSVDELDLISGIGPARLEQLRALVTP